MRDVEKDHDAFFIGYQSVVYTKVFLFFFAFEISRGSSFSDSRRSFLGDEERGEERRNAISSPNRVGLKEREKKKRKKGKKKKWRRRGKEKIQRRDKRRERGRSHATYIKRTIITRCIAIRFFSKYTRIHIHI